MGRRVPARVSWKAAKVRMRPRTDTGTSARRYSSAIPSQASASAMTGSPCVTAYWAAACTKPGVHVLENSISLEISGMSCGGAVTQPIRQPVISQVLENELALTSRSPSSTTGAATRL